MLLKSLVLNIFQKLSSENRRPGLISFVVESAVKSNSLKNLVKQIFISNFAAQFFEE
ncbi:hypothetical protein MNBD_BACTEROID07-2118 [hydrothermal vent metagenome]|uniref:Uncharacterized protein n=1 Tax=hydrothermal vent metagenome TaxID=652676 RepID=A0A3B0UNW0_9ZZZZ